MRKPEILAPAGNLEKLKIAIDFGADAVYIGGAKLNLRAFSNNFSNHLYPLDNLCYPNPEEYYTLFPLLE